MQHQVAAALKVDPSLVAVASTGVIGQHLPMALVVKGDRKSTRLNSSHTEIYTLSLHDALPIYATPGGGSPEGRSEPCCRGLDRGNRPAPTDGAGRQRRSEEHTSELQSHRDLHSFPTRRSSDLCNTRWRQP